MLSLEKLDRRSLVRSAVALSSMALAVPQVKTAASGVGPYFEDRGWLVGCWTRPWASHDYRVGFDAIAQAGFRYVALTGAKTASGRVIAPTTSLEDAIQVGQEARQRGLTITTVYGGNVALDKGPAELLRMLELCKAAGGWSVLLSNVGDEKSFESCCKVIAECCLQAEASNLAIVLKPHGGTTGTGPQLRDCIQKVNHKCFTLMYDPGNIFYYSQGKIDPIEDSRSVHGLVTGISVKDFKAPNEVMFTPGSGMVEFPKLLKGLKSAGFTHGPLMIEALTPGDLVKTLEEARKAKAIVEQWIRGLDI